VQGENGEKSEKEAYDVCVWHTAFTENREEKHNGDPAKNRFKRRGPGIETPEDVRGGGERERTGLKRTMTM